MTRGPAQRGFDTHLAASFFISQSVATASASISSAGSKLLFGVFPPTAAATVPALPAVGGLVCPGVHGFLSATSASRGTFYYYNQPMKPAPTTSPSSLGFGSVAQSSIMSLGTGTSGFFWT